MTNGIIFDIKEFAINDGPGIRTTIFLKGCPLNCIWCHNPESINRKIEKNLLTEKLIGYEVSSQELAQKLLSSKDLFDFTNGGVTFSGGEPLLQSRFITETCLLLKGVHKLLDTSGQISQAIFKQSVQYFDMIYFDLKIFDRELHKRFTGSFNDVILANARYLATSNIKYTIRVPLIPCITDTVTNLTSIAEFVETFSNPPESIDLLPYNLYAGGKYKSIGKIFPLQHIKEYVVPEQVHQIVNNHSLMKLLRH